LDVLLPNVRIGDDQKPTLDTAQHQSQTSPALIQKAKMILDHLIFLLESTHDTASIHDSGSHRVALICTCRNEQSIHHELLQVTRFPERFEITKSLRQDQRVHLFKAMMADLQLPLLNADQLKVLITKTEGYRPMDVHTVATRVASAYELNRLRENLSSLKDDELLSKLINENLLSYTPLSKKSFTQEAYRVATPWPFIGGLFKAKEDLAHIILRPVRYKGIYNHCPISLPRGILLFGPSGCGKSCIVPALAEEIGFNLVTCRGPEILDKYIGMSEAKVRRLFEQAYTMSPSILFFDDFDALAPKRGRDSTGATDRVVNQLLTYLDGVEGRIKEKGYVYIIAATSRPDKVDPALLRPGRLESHIYIGPPENTDEWADLFSKIALSRNDVGKDLQDWIQSGLYLKDLADINIGYQTMLIPTDIRSAFDDARLSTLHSQLSLLSSISSKLCIHRHQLISALSNLHKRSQRIKMVLVNTAFDTFLQDRSHNIQAVSQDSRGIKQILR
jgi:peroxin-1